MDESFELGGLDESFTEVTVSTSVTCDICAYTTKKKSNLRRHMKIHQDRTATDVNNECEIYPHLCGECGKRYKSVVGLTHHVKRVTGKHSLTTAQSVIRGTMGLRWDKT